MSDEKVFFEDRDVTVTSSRFLTFGKTQALSGITSVSSYVQKPNRKLPIILAIVGLICFYFSWIIAVLVIAAAAVWMYFQKTYYTIQLESASGTTDALTDTDNDFIFKVVDAINEAIVYRG
jgi:hypothetical protein